MVIGDRPQGSPRAGFLEKQTQGSDQRGRNDGGNHVFHIDQNTARKHALQNECRLFGHADVNLVDGAAEDGLSQPIEEVSDAQRGHQQRDTFLVNQVAKHQPLNQPGQNEHANRSGHEAEDVAKELVFKTHPLRNPL